jgi:hypothetical protein
MELVRALIEEVRLTLEDGVLQIDRKRCGAPTFPALI